jgi:glycosyltransferase involved in cell wall biosynthesis
MTANILYISYDGMTDNLGQSQVIPYLIGLSKLGYNITILSCEKHENYKLKQEQIATILSNNNIHWSPINYTASPPILSTIKDIVALRKKAKYLQSQTKFDIVHCRSYISAKIGVWMKQKYGTKFVFDMRGFWADERVDGGIWNLKNPIFYIVYKYFKYLENRYLLYSDYIISLTYTAKEFLLNKTSSFSQSLKIKVIPCCADLEHFKQSENIKFQTLELRKKLDIDKNDFVLSYLGSLGTWYMQEEMFDFFKTLLIVKPQSKFLFITTDSPEYIYSIAKVKNIPKESILVRKASRDEVPVYISLSDVSIFFIKPLFSKKASSPTKMGEILAMGVPIVCNSNVGDVESIMKNSNSGWLINNFSQNEYKSIINNMLNDLPLNKDDLRNTALKYYSLEDGIIKYNEVYKNMI